MDKHSKRSASIFRYPVLIAFTLFDRRFDC